MTDFFAYSFKSDLTLQQIFARLNEAGPWQWVEWANDNWGDYIWARTSTEHPAPDRVKVMICVETDHYVIYTRFKSETPDAKAKLEALRATLFEKVLPAVGARDLSPADTDTYD